MFHKINRVIGSHISIIAVMTERYTYSCDAWGRPLTVTHRPDPLCEKYYSLSPYAYCAGNPVNVMDPKGRDKVLVIDKDYRPIDNGTVGSTYSAEVYVIQNGVVSEKYRGSSYLNSISNKNNATRYNTVKEGAYPGSRVYC